MDFSSLPFPTELVLSFLTIREVSDFGCTSIDNLELLAMPELWRRRQRLKERFAYRRTWNLSNRTHAARIRSLSDSSGSGAIEEDEDYEWVPMATVEERVRQLSDQIPMHHAMYGEIRDLQRELTRELPAHQGRLPLPDLLKRLRETVLPLKLYATVMSQTFRSTPLNSTTCATTLDQYLGDVLILTYLFNVNDFGIVEGVPSNTDYYQVLRNGRLDDSPASLYRAWVHIHSSILRTKSFSKAQSESLGVPCDESLSKTSEMVRNDCCFVNEPFLSSEMRLLTYDFGPLGVAFRGRDVLQVREVSARCLVSFFVSGTAHQQGTTAQNALAWLRLLHQETRKNRPMTVRPPMIALSLPDQA
jgi:hypothetical protein